jgi:Prohead core protein serine protease
MTRPQLLVETSQAYITEEKHGKFYIECNMLIGNKINLNKRFYPADPVLKESVDAVQDRIRQGNFFGHLGHQPNPVGNPVAVSHIVESLTRKGDSWWGVGRVISEGSGKILKSILAANGAVGFSTAGLGSTKKRKDGIFEVTSPYKLLHVDAVLDPSNGIDAHVRALRESIASETIHPDSYSVVIDLLTQLGHPDLVKTQKRNSIDWDRDVMRYTSRNNTATWLELLERDRPKLPGTNLPAVKNLTNDRQSMWPQITLRRAPASLPVLEVRGRSAPLAGSPPMTQQRHRGRRAEAPLKPVFSPIKTLV